MRLPQVVSRKGGPALLVTLAVTFLVSLLLRVFDYRFTTTFTDDFAVDLLWAETQLRDGIQLHGHFSRTLAHFHPGPTYMWVLVASTWFAETSGALSPDVMAYLLMTVAVVALAGLSAYIAAKASGRRAVGYGIILMLSVWQLLPMTEENWLHSARIGAMVWAPYLMPWVALLVVVSAVALAAGWRWGPGWATAGSYLAISIYLPYAPIGVPVLIAASVLAYRRRRDRAVLRSYLLATLPGVPLFARLVTEGPLFWVPLDPVLDQASRYNPETAGYHFDQAIEGVGIHLGVPGWVGLTGAALTVIYLAVSAVRAFRTGNMSHGSVCTVVAVFIVYAFAQMVLVFPSPLQYYQSSWVEPAYLAALGTAVALLAARIPYGTAALLTTTAIAMLALSFAPAAANVRLAVFDVAVIDDAITTASSKIPKGTSVILRESGDMYESVSVMLRAFAKEGFEVCLERDRADLRPFVCASGADGLVVEIIPGDGGNIGNREVLGSFGYSTYGAVHRFALVIAENQPGAVGPPAASNR